VTLVYNWTNKLLFTLFPQVCRLCLAPVGQGGMLCAACCSELPWLPRTCAGCAIPLPAGTQATHCPQCQKTPPHLDRCQALFAYAAPIDQWIQAMKFRQDLTAARLLGGLLARRVAVNHTDRPLHLLPVPLHRSRLRVRGYNQSLEIARQLAGRGYALRPGVCLKHRATTAQSDLPASARRDNVRGAFSVTRPLQGERFLLVDDVLTTGATLNELAHTLKNAGAEHVEAWVIARTVERENDGD